MLNHPLPQTQQPRARRGSALRAATGMLAALLLAAMCGCRPASKATPPPNRPSPKASATSGETAPSPLATDGGNYRAIGERDLFRPLVAVPKAAEGGGGGGEAKGGPGGAGGKAGGKGGPNAAPGGPPRPPDPTADLALTGIIETTDGLRALVEQISTRKGEFVAVGEQAFGFTVKALEAKAITLAQGPRTYELTLGAKEMPSVEPAAVASAPSPTPSPSASPAPSSPPSGMPDFGGMSSDQRRQAFQDWWNGMSEQQRQDFRSRRGGGGGGGPGGGFGGGRRGGGGGGPRGR